MGKYGVHLFVIGFPGLSIETKGLYALLAERNVRATPVLTEHGACMGTLGLMECQKRVLYVVRKH